MNNFSFLSLLVFLILLSCSTLCASSELPSSSQYDGGTVPDKEERSELKNWKDWDLHSLEASLESGVDVHRPIDTVSVRNIRGLYLRDSMSLMEIAMANWWYFPESFEIILRYARRDVSDLENGNRASHLLADSSGRFFNEGRRQFPNVYFVDLYTMALDGFMIQPRNTENRTPFYILANRIIDEGWNTRVTENRLVLALETFHKSSKEEDWFQASDVELVSNYQPEIDGRRSNVLTWIENNNLENVPKTLRPLTPGAFEFGRMVAANCWFLDDVWHSPVQKKYAEFFSLNNAGNRGRSSNLHSLTNARIVNETRYGVGEVSFPMQAYASRYYDELVALLDSGDSPDTVLTIDLYNLVTAPNKFFASPSFCPKKGDNILLAAALDPFSKSDMLPLILKHTNNADVRDLLNRNALHRFLYHRVQDEQKHLLKLLIEAGVDVNARSVSGNTPCHVATNRNAHLIPELVNAGADIYAKNDRGETAVDLLKRSISEKWIFFKESELVLESIETKRGTID